MDRERKCRKFAILHISQYVVIIITILKIVHKYKNFLGGVVFHNMVQAYRMLPLGIGIFIIYNLLLKSLGYFWYLEEAKKLKCDLIMFFLEDDRISPIIYESKHPYLWLFIAIFLIIIQFVIDHYIPYGRFF